MAHPFRRQHKGRRTSLFQFNPVETEVQESASVGRAVVAFDDNVAADKREMLVPTRLKRCQIVRQQPRI